MEQRLSYDFFAHNLIGKILVWNGIPVIITETESYRGLDDAASHAYKGPTNRTKIMFGPPGVSYVYIIYGIHHCLNIITEPDGHPSAVLIRAIQTLNDHHIIKGPGNVCKFLNITRHDNGIDLLSDPLYKVLDTQETSTVLTTPRIGISKNKDILWRFVMKRI